jgi:hypothetical protein
MGSGEEERRGLDQYLDYGLIRWDLGKRREEVLITVYLFSAETKFKTVCNFVVGY